MNYTDIQARLDVIRNLPICELDERQPLLVALMADIVNYETSDGDDTDSDWGLERQDYWKTLKIKAKDAGFNLLGNGHFSAAFKHKLLPGRVIKVGFKKEDSGAAYVAFCRMHQGRVGIPNVYHVARHAGCYTVVLDELEPCQRRENETHEHYADLANYFVENSGAELGDVDGAEKELPFVETCQMINKFFHGIASFDMHSGNIMFTKDGKPVITDPVSFSADRDREPFSLEPEDLIAEIEQIAHDKMIERCKRNKAKRDPNGTFQRDRKYLNKARRARAKAFARRRKEREKRDAEILKEGLAKVEERVLAWQVGPGLAIQQGKPLPIDNYLQGRLMG
ncbi:serine-threonine kinase [Klebsiella phage KP32_isolate 195]|uniref:Protein kinase n=1 Tax=Klebsiella phage KP32_isolate 195 TaxID=2790306 RepID=A0A2U8USM1_9CAUD|nr:serine-threonine kinase [Klebsiella phage KP32_isolate 195]AWN07135.1 protein kinase [Klebsiella phage KP32_isolate 195]